MQFDAGLLLQVADDAEQVAGLRISMVMLLALRMLASTS
jgi:hypothetical protein